MTAEKDNKTWTIYRKGWGEALKHLRFALLKTKKSHYSKEDFEKALQESAAVQKQSIHLDDKNFTEEQLKAAYEAGLKENDEHKGFIIRTMFDGIYKKAFEEGKQTGISVGKKIEAENNQGVVKKYQIEISQFNRTVATEREVSHKEGYSKGYHAATEDMNRKIDSIKKEAHEKGYIEGRERFITYEDIRNASNKSYDRGFEACKQSWRFTGNLIARRFLISVTMGYVLYEWKMKPYFQENDRLLHGETLEQADTRRKITYQCSDIAKMSLKGFDPDLRKEWYALHAKCQEAADFHEAMKQEVQKHKGKNQFFGPRRKAGYQDISNDSEMITSSGISPDLDCFIQKCSKR